MKKFANYLPVLLAIVITVMLSTSLYAQPDPPLPPDSNSVPLDPLSWMLLAAGRGIAVRKFMKEGKKNL